MDCYPEENTQPVVLPTTAEYIWKKFKYFDKKADEYPNDVEYEEMKLKLLALWWKQFQKEVRSNETTE